MGKNKNNLKSPVRSSKYLEVVSNGPPLGAYDIEKAEALTKPKAPATAVLKEPLNLYTKPESIRPEATSSHVKPFGSDVKGKVDMGSKYVTKIKQTPEAIGLDQYEKSLAATKPKTSAAYFGAPQTMADGSRSPERNSTISTAEIKHMSIEEKMELLMQLR